ncbi:MAG: PrsW family intramembrane metalloprotease [Actinomycetales bacterium]
MIRPRRPGAVRGLVWVGVVVVLAFSALVTLFVIGLSTGPVASLVGLLLAVLPVFPVAAALLWLDRYEDEPPALLAFAFAWGATAAVVISLVFSIGSMIVIAGAGGSDALGAVVVAPVVEESAKGLAIIGVLLIRRSQFNGVVDGIVYAGLSGLGFAFAENILYLGSAFLDGGITGAVLTFILRCVMGPFAHPMFTAAFGIGVGLAVRARTPGLKVLYPVLGLITAMCLHALWNGMTLIGGLGSWFVGYVLLQVPIFAGFVGFAVVVRRREARLINEHLRVYAESGWITGQELAMLSSADGRRQARSWAARVAGPQGKTAMRDFQELASELSFLRERMANHAAPADAQRTEADLLRSMWQLRLGFQPAPGR